MTKKDRKLRCKEILNNNPIGYFVIGSDKKFLIETFENHPNWNEKIGVGGRSIFIDRDNFKGRCFWIIRVDGSVVSISYLSSISGVGIKPIDKIKKACRSAITPEINKFRFDNVDYGITRCDVSGVVLTRNNINIDHYDLTFIDMFNLWIKDKDINYISSKIKKENQIYNFTQKGLYWEFRTFHNKHCKLRAVTSEVNQILLRNGIKTTEY